MVGFLVGFFHSRLSFVFEFGCLDRMVLVNVWLRKKNAIKFNVSNVFFLFFFWFLFNFRMTEKFYILNKETNKKVEMAF